MAKIRGEDGSSESHYLFYDGESIAGTVHINLKKAGQKLEHQGIRIEFVGQIGEDFETYKDVSVGFVLSFSYPSTCEYYSELFWMQYHSNLFYADSLS